MYKTVEDHNCKTTYCANNQYEEHTTKAVLNIAKHLE